MDIKQIITDYIMKSILTTQGDLVVRGAAIPERLVAVALNQVFKSGGVGALPAWGFPSLKGGKVAVGTVARSTAGDEVVTGVGFEPVIFVFVGRSQESNLINNSWGYDIVTDQRCSWIGDDQVLAGNSDVYSIFLRRALNNWIGGEVSATGGDGFTITFTMTGTSNIRSDWLAIG